MPDYYIIVLWIYLSSNSVPGIKAKILQYFDFIIFYKTWPHFDLASKKRFTDTPAVQSGGLYASCGGVPQAGWIHKQAIMAL
jgi:hypothetical protein